MTEKKALALLELQAYYAKREAEDGATRHHEPQVCSFEDCTNEANHFVDQDSPNDCQACDGYSCEKCKEPDVETFYLCSDCQYVNTKCLNCGLAFHDDDEDNAVMGGHHACPHCETEGDEFQGIDEGMYPGTDGEMYETGRYCCWSESDGDQGFIECHTCELL